MPLLNTLYMGRMNAKLNKGLSPPMKCALPCLPVERGKTMVRRFQTGGAPPAI
jgi:hypothetical protein